MRRRSRTRWLWVGLGAVLVVAGAFGVAYLQGGPDSGPARVPPPAPEETGAAVPGPPTEGADAAAQYVVVESDSQARYRVAETFFQFNREAVAVGTTGAVSGSFSLKLSEAFASVSGVIRADISRLTSDEPRRDRAIRDRWLESARFPVAEFRPTAVDLAEPYQEGREVPVTIRGELMIREVTRSTVWTGSLRLEGDTLRATLSTQIRMTDFGFDPPSILGMLRAEDEATLEVELVARRAQG